MAGILNKKSRLIDYKLTEHGRKQIASGDISFKYYNFSDSSIVYHEKLNTIDKISDSEYYYLPFEATTDPGFYVNPEYSLSDALSYEDTNDSFFEVSDMHNVFQTTIENIIDKKYLTTKKRKSNLIFENINEFVFENITIKENYDFVDETFIRKYPTVSSLVENVNNLIPVRYDKRFKDTLKYKMMAPLNKKGESLIRNTSQDYNYKVNCLYKSLTLNADFSAENSKDRLVTKIINSIQKNKKHFHYLKYDLSPKNAKENDSFMFEMHELIDSENFTKIPFVKVGSFFDFEKNRYLDVYLIGKFIKKKIEDEVYNVENNTTKINNIDEYYFINMFTLVVEK